jgi:hypothetical protein
VISSSTPTRFNGNFRLEQHLFEADQRCAVLLPRIRSLTSKRISADQTLKIILSPEIKKKDIIKKGNETAGNILLRGKPRAGPAFARAAPTAGSAIDEINA